MQIRQFVPIDITFIHFIVIFTTILFLFLKPEKCLKYQIIAYYNGNTKKISVRSLFNYILFTYYSDKIVEKSIATLKQNSTYVQCICI